MGSPEVDQDYIGPKLTWNLTGSGPKVDPEVDRKWPGSGVELHWKSSICCIVPGKNENGLEGRS